MNAFILDDAMNGLWILDCSCGASINMSAASILESKGEKLCLNCDKALPMDSLKEAASGYLTMCRAFAAISMPPKPEWTVQSPW